MKKITVIFLLISSTIFAQNFIVPSEKISFALNHHTNRDVVFFSKVDGHENIIIIATTERDSTFTDILTTKLDSNLNLIWQKRFSLKTDLSYDIPLNSFLDARNNIYVTGRSSTERSKDNGLLFVVKYDANGNELWSLNLDDYNDSASSDYFYQNSFLDTNGFLHIVHAKANRTSTAVRFHFYTINGSGNITESFFREDLLRDPNFTRGRYDIFFKNDHYYMRYSRHNITSDPYFYEYFIKKISATSLEVYPLNSIIELNDASLFNQGNITVDANSNIYLTYQSGKTDTFKILKLDSSGNMVYYKSSSANYDKYLFISFINSSNNLSIISNSKLSTSTDNETLNLLVYGSSGDIIANVTVPSTYINGIKRYKDHSILVFSNGGFKLFDENLSLVNDFIGPYNDFTDFNKINDSNLVISKTTFAKLYPESVFFAQQDLEVLKINPNQITNTYTFSGKGTSKAFKQKLIIDNEDNYIIASEEKMGPDNWDPYDGSRAPLRKTIYKYDTNLNLLWSLNIDNAIVNPNSSNDENFLIGANNNLFINSMGAHSSFKLIKISEKGNFLFKVPSYPTSNIYLDQNNNINVVSFPIYNPSTNDYDTSIYTLSSDDGSLLNTEIFEGLQYLDNYKTSTSDSYIYMYTGDNSSGDTSPKLYIYKNFRLQFQTDLAITGTYGGIDSYSVGDKGNITFSSSWGQNNQKLNRIKLDNSYSFINVNNSITRVLSIPNGKVFTVARNGVVSVYNSDLSLFSRNGNTYYEYPYLLKIDGHVLFYTSFNNVMKVFDKNAQMINEFKLPSSMSMTYADTDSNNNLILTGQFGSQIYLYHEYSWARGFVHKYNFSSFDLNIEGSQLISNRLKIYPNPSDHLINVVSFKGLVSDISLYDLNGRLLYQYNKSPIDISNLPPAIYLIKIILNDGTILNKKIIKK